MPLLSRLTTFGAAKEITQGTPITTPTIWVPATSIKPEDLIEEVKDESFFGNPTLVRGIYQGVKDATFDFDGPCYPDIIGNWLVALGLADTVTGTGTYTHTFKLSSAQPPSYTFLHNDVYESRAWPGNVLESLDIKIDTKGMVTYATKWKGWPSATASNGTPAYTTTTPFLPWNGTTTYAGGSDANLLSGSVTLKRAVEPIHTINGTQNPNTVWAGPFEASCKLDFVFTSNTEINQFRTYVQSNPLQLALAQGSNPVLTLIFNKPGSIKSATDSSKSFYTVTVDIEGIYNTTDAGSFSATLLNSVSTQY